jgi:class 3 adenylate cyclase
MASRPPAAHRTIFVIDVEGFANHSRTNKNQITVREGLKQAWQQAFSHAGISWTDCTVEDRGDGVFILAPAEMPKAPFVDSVPLELAAALREHNTTHPKEEHIRLRMALHAGEVELDDSGSTGAAIMLAFRLLSAQPLKDALARSTGVLALITSEWFYNEVVRHSNVTEPASFRKVVVSVKETTTMAWISLPDQTVPPKPFLPLPAPSARIQPFLRSLKLLWSGSRM